MTIKTQWPGPEYMSPSHITLSHCDTPVDTKGLTISKCQARIKRCKSSHKQYAKKMADHKESMLLKIRAMEERALLRFNCEFPAEEDSLKVLRKIVSKSVKQYYHRKEKKAKAAFEKCVKALSTKMDDLQKVEKSLQASKKSSEQIMEEHWEIITDESWAPLNNPHLMREILGFFSIAELKPVMSTCSRLLHFVHAHVPIAIKSKRMGSSSYVKWLLRFSHFKLLDCTPLANRKKKSMYHYMANLAESKRIDALAVNQPADYSPTSFEKFQRMFQKHQHNLTNLTVAASLVPCFLSDDQLGKLQSLTLLSAVEDNANFESWVEKFPHLSTLKELCITSYNASLKSVSIPASVEKLQLYESDYVKEELPNNAPNAYHRRRNNNYNFSLPDVQDCQHLRELWLRDVQDISALGLLPTQLKLLTITADDDVKLTFPKSMSAEKLVLSDVLPPSSCVDAKEVTLFHRDRAMITKQFTAPFPGISETLETLSIVGIGHSVSVDHIIELENGLSDATKLVFLEETVSLSRDRMTSVGSYSLLLKYALLECAKDPTRCIIRGIPITEAPDRWFHRDVDMCTVCGCSLGSEGYREESRCNSCRKGLLGMVIDETLNRNQHIKRAKQLCKKRKRAEEREGKSKKRKISHAE